MTQVSKFLSSSNLEKAQCRQMLSLGLIESFHNQVANSQPRAQHTDVQSQVLYHSAIRVPQQQQLSACNGIQTQHGCKNYLKRQWSALVVEVSYNFGYALSLLFCHFVNTTAYKCADTSPHLPLAIDGQTVKPPLITGKVKSETTVYSDRL